MEGYVEHAIRDHSVANKRRVEDSQPCANFVGEQATCDCNGRAWATQIGALDLVVDRSAISSRDSSM